MKLISWNVNGLRACIQKGFLDFFHETDADIFCIQESKLQEGQIDLPLPGYFSYWNYAKKKGYSGTAIFTKKEPLNVTYGIGIEEHDKEGRVITLEYPDFYMVTCYTPNSQNELARLPYRMQWEDDFRAYLKRLDGSKPVILCGDLNVAHICFHNNSIMDCKNMWIEFCRNKCLSIKPIIFCPTIGDLKIITESYVYIDVCWGLISSEGICHNIKVQRIKNGETGDECGYMFDSINDTVPTFPCSFWKEYYIPMH